MKCANHHVPRCQSWFISEIGTPWEAATWWTRRWGGHLIVGFFIVDASGFGHKAWPDSNWLLLNERQRQKKAEWMSEWVSAHCTFPKKDCCHLCPACLAYDTWGLLDASSIFSVFSIHQHACSIHPQLKIHLYSYLASMDMLILC